MSIFSDALIDGILLCVFSVPFAVLNTIIIKVIFREHINFLSLTFIWCVMLSVCFVFGITCFSDIHYDTFNINNILLKDNLNLNAFTSINQFFVMSLSGNLRAILNLYGNIGVFIPVGFFVYGVTFAGQKYKIIKVTIWCCLISLCIELFQVTFNRMGDIDDIILNTFGGFVGCLLFVFINNIFDMKSKIHIDKLILSKKLVIFFGTAVIWIAFLVFVFFISAALGF